MVVEGIGEKDFEEWRKAYAKCKKQGSKVFNDGYDKEFLKKIVDGYKKTIGKGTSCRFENALGFMEFVRDKCKEYIEKSTTVNKKSWTAVDAYVYTKARDEAVAELLGETFVLIETLRKKLKEYSDKLSAESTTPISTISKVTKKIFGKSISENLMVTTKNAKCIKSIVIDIPYTGTEFTSLRLYILLKATDGLLKNLNTEKFYFKHYVLNEQNYEDKYFNDRKIYKVFSAPIKVSLAVVGNIQLEVYISANDLVSGKALDYVELNQENVFFGKELVK